MKTAPKNVSPNEAKEIADAARAAYGNQTADEFFDEMVSYLPKYRKIFASKDQQTVTE